MTANENNKQINSEDWIATEEGLTRNLSGWSKKLLATIAIAWSLFQLIIATKWVLLESFYLKTIHLTFAFLLLFLGQPFLKKQIKKFPVLSAKNHIPIYDIILALLTLIPCLYILYDREGIALRARNLNQTDIIIGILLFTLLIEACRRCLGPALSIIALTFSLYAFTAPNMPDIIAWGGTTLNRFIDTMTMADAGIYGIPLGVSVETVFLFVLFGSMLERAGGGKYFTQLALSAMGRYRGGPAKAAVVASALTGMVSGSSIANVVTTGTFTIPLMKRTGYPAKIAAAIEVAASTNGQLAPPIMGAAAFIIAVNINQQYIQIIKAAAIPAFASYITLIYITHLEALKLGLKKVSKKEIPNFLKTLISGAHFLIALIALITMLVLQYSPQMAALVACIVMALIQLVQEIVINRKTTSLIDSTKKGIKEILAGLESGAKNMVTVALACAGAGIIVGVVSMGPAGMMTQIVDKLAMGNIYLMLLITALLSLIIGMGLPTTATYITMSALMAGVIIQLGASYGIIIPAVAAHLFVFYFGILADDTPPVGLAAYAGAAIAKSPPIATGIQGFLYDLRTAILPFMFVLNSDLILHQITNPLQIILIFITCSLGCCAFAAAAQNHYRTKNKIYETPILLIASFILLRPDTTARFLNIPHDQRYTTALIAIALLIALHLYQKHRTKKSALVA